MAYPRSLQQQLRKSKLFVGAGFRAYFAPFDKAAAVATFSTAVGPTVVDLAQGPFDTATPPVPFADLGWIKDVKLTPASKIGVVRSGYRGAVRAIYRGQVEETFELKFREYARMQMKLATGTNVLNLLAGTTPTTAGPISASGAASTSMSSYSVTGGVATLTVASASGFAVGTYVVCDIDYDTTTYGLVGDAGTPVFKNTVTDVDYIRKNSDYVARVAAVNGTALTLDQPFIGGGSNGHITPQAGSKVQRIVGWASREGGTFVSEWSALFLLDTVDQAQIAIYYPHAVIMQNRDVTAAWAIENAGTTDLTGYELDVQVQALAYDDPLDGETVVSYKAYYEKPGTSPGY